MKNILLTFFITFLIFTKCIAEIKSPISYNINQDSTQTGVFKDTLTKGRTGSSSGYLTFTIGLITVLYLLNPIILFENNKIAGGISKELSVGFGYFGEHRFALDYSYIFRAESNSFLRFSYKYDILLKDNIKPSHILQGSPVLSFGGGYFTDFHGNGFFPEVSYGYSLRNHKLLIYPNLKLRYTVMTTKEKKNIIDFSFGITIGIANPFIDLKIRNFQ